MSNTIKSALLSARSMDSRIEGISTQKRDIEQCIFNAMTLPNISGHEGYPNAVRENLDKALHYLEQFSFCVKQAASSNNKHIDVLQEELARENKRDSESVFNDIASQIQRAMASLNTGDHAVIVVRKESVEDPETILD